MVLRRGGGSHESAMLYTTVQILGQITAVVAVQWCLLSTWVYIRCCCIYIAHTVILPSACDRVCAFYAPFPASVKKSHRAHSLSMHEIMHHSILALLSSCDIRPVPTLRAKHRRERAPDSEGGSRQAPDQKSRCVWVCLYDVCMLVRGCVYMYMRIYVCMLMFVCVYVRMCMYLCMCMCA